VRTGRDDDPVKEIGEFWNKQDEQYEFDYLMYNSKPWLIAKTVFSLSILTLTFLLYGLHEMPWTIFASAPGLMILLAAPFFAGLIMGYAFENPKWALAYSLIVSFSAIGLNFLLFRLPDIMSLADYGPGFMSNVWWYGYFLPFIITISCVPAGAMVASSTNVYE